MFLTGFKKVSWNLYINTASWRVPISDSLITFKSVNKGLECSVKLKEVEVIRRFCCLRRRRCKSSVISKRREKKWKRKKLERILKEHVFSARRYRRSTSSTQGNGPNEKRNVSALARLVVLIIWFDPWNVVEVLRRNRRHGISCCHSRFCVFYPLYYIVRENWRRNRENMKRNCI